MIAPRRCWRRSATAAHAIPPRCARRRRRPGGGRGRVRQAQGRVLSLGLQQAPPPGLLHACGQHPPLAPLGRRPLRRCDQRGQDHPRAIRTLGRAWCRVVWRCWQDGVPYDIALHHGAQQHLAVPIPTPSGTHVDLPATQRMAGDALTPSVEVGPVQGSLRAAQPSLPPERSKGGQSRAARQGRAKRAA